MNNNIPVEALLNREGSPVEFLEECLPVGLIGDEE